MNKKDYQIKNTFTGQCGIIFKGNDFYYQVVKLNKDMYRINICLNTKFDPKEFNKVGYAIIKAKSYFINQLLSITYYTNQGLSDLGTLNQLNMTMATNGVKLILSMDLNKLIKQVHNSKSVVENKLKTEIKQDYYSLANQKSQILDAKQKLNNIKNNN